MQQPGRRKGRRIDVDAAFENGVATDAEIATDGRHLRFISDFQSRRKCCSPEDDIILKRRPDADDITWGTREHVIEASSTVTAIRALRTALVTNSDVYVSSSRDFRPFRAAHAVEKITGTPKMHMFIRAAATQFFPERLQNTPGCSARLGLHN